MTQLATLYRHITFNDQNVPIIEGTTMKVIELVVERIAYGWSPEELHFQHPYLSLGQIHSALAYYWDHQAEMDAAIEEQLRRVDAMRQAAPELPLITRLKAQGLI